jgi:hypothetical protein
MSQVTLVERGQAVDYYHAGRLLAVAAPPRPHELSDQWVAKDCEGRAVEVNNREEAMRRALAYADAWIIRNTVVVAS